MKIKHFINGEWAASEAGATFASTDPADTRDVVANVAAGTRADVDKAVAAAREAFRSWRLVPAPKRGEILFRAAEALAREKPRLAALVTREMGKVAQEANGDVQEASDIAYYMAGEGRRLSGETVPSELADKYCKSVRVPVGVFALISPWNYPTAIPALKIFAALISGNTAVFKPSSLTPACGTEVVRILADAGVPRGVLNMVHGPGGEVGEYLASHPGVDGVSFTGSSAVGARLAERCARPGKVIACEMGGKNAVVVMDDADIDLAVEGATWGGFGMAGQRCTASSRVIVHEAVYDAFLERFTEAARRLKVGSGASGADVGPLVSAEQLAKVDRYVAIGREEGARIILGGRRGAGEALEHGYFFEPTIFVDVSPKMRIAREEIFGPVVSVLKAGSLEEAIEISNCVDYGLVTSIYTRDIRKAAIAERDLDTGIVYINASTIGAEIQLPFGGEKISGYGGKEAGGRGGGLDIYTRWKVVYHDFSGRLQKAQITA